MTWEGEDNLSPALSKGEGVAIGKEEFSPRFFKGEGVAEGEWGLLLAVRTMGSAAEGEVEFNVPRPSMVSEGELTRLPSVGREDSWTEGELLSPRVVWEWGFMFSWAIGEWVRTRFSSVGREDSWVA